MKDYIVKTLNGMAYGLFATLIIGVILQQIGKITNISFLEKDLYQLLSSLMGVGIAVGIGVALKKDGLFLVMLAIVGAIATKFQFNYQGLFNKEESIILVLNGAGNPLTAYFVPVFTIIFMEAILQKKTPVDIILIPLVAIFLSIIITFVLSYPLDKINYYIGQGILKATNFAPIIMTIIISVVMGMLLTAPISSAAIAIAVLGNNPVAAGAAVVGTTIQMIGFAIQSRRDNNLGTVFSIAFGTSMLQFKNIVKKPIIWLPTILSSAITAPFLLLLDLKSDQFGAGMGTSGLVGILRTLDVMGYNNYKSWLSIIIIVVVGGLLVYIFDKILYMKGFIKDGDLSIEEGL